jgi:hypothetical protein
MKVKITKPSSIWGKARYELLEDEVILDHVVKRGFVTDFGTVPRLFWWLVPPVSSYLEAALLHDYLLAAGRNRKYCDNKFYEAMVEYGVSTLATNFIYTFATLYGRLVKPMDYINFKGY